jgi:hypothetical protein
LIYRERKIVNSMYVFKNFTQMIYTDDGAHKKASYEGLQR